MAQISVQPARMFVADNRNPSAFIQLPVRSWEYSRFRDSYAVRAVISLSSPAVLKDAMDIIFTRDIGGIYRYVADEFPKFALSLHSDDKQDCLKNCHVVYYAFRFLRRTVEVHIRGQLESTPFVVPQENRTYELISIGTPSIIAGGKMLPSNSDYVLEGEKQHCICYSQLTIPGAAIEADLADLVVTLGNQTIAAPHSLVSLQEQGGDR